jgi:hypothetical protein
MMSERFPDEVLLKAFDKAEAAAGNGNRIRLDPQRIDAAIVAAMRAVLEGHLLERKEMPIRFEWRDAETDGPDGAGAQVVVAYPNPNHPDGWNLRVQWTPLRAELAPMPALWRPLDWPAPPVEASDGSLS